MLAGGVSPSTVSGRPALRILASTSNAPRTSAPHARYRIAKDAVLRRTPCRKGYYANGQKDIAPVTLFRTRGSPVLPIPHPSKSRLTRISLPLNAGYGAAASNSPSAIRGMRPAPHRPAETDDRPDTRPAPWAPPA